jgi:hypothetical protein
LRLAARRGVAIVLLAATAATAQADTRDKAPAAPGPGLRRAANLQDGAPAFVVLDAAGQPIRRIECIWNGWYEADAMAARLMASPRVMAAIVAKDGLIAIDDLGPAIFDCVVVPAPRGR